MKHKVICMACMLVLLFSLGGCLFFEDEGPRTINDCIRRTNQAYDEITELVCDPGPDRGFRDSGYDLLAKLVNLESISIVGIADRETAQLIFAELAKLEKLRAVELTDSRVGTIGKLSEIKSLTSLSIVFTGQSSTYMIEDIELIGQMGSFKNLETLKLDMRQLEELPDLHNMENLAFLTVCDFGLTRIDYSHANWNALVHFDIRYADITAIDNRIVDELYNLEYLDITSTKIQNIEFVLRLPKLTYFAYRNHANNDVDMEPLRQHPNFNESWIT